MGTKIGLGIGLLALSLLMNSCDYESIRVSDTLETRNFSVPDYSGIEVSHTFNAYVRFSESEETIAIEANANVQDRIVVEKEGNTLRIRLKRHTKLRGDVVLNAYITTRDLSNIRTSGASNLLLETPWVTSNANINVSGASDLQGEVDVETLRIAASGASSIDLFGKADSVTAELTGSSDFRDYDLNVNELDIVLHGASDAWLSVNESISIDASGASEFRYRGNAEIRHEKLSGASEIIQVD
ncbi:MAG: head GIN domain-containing protein [Bacteroidota bacterium]